MNKSALKKFAQFARTKLIADMKQQISYWEKAKEVSGGLQTIDGKIVNGEHTRAKQSMTNELVKKSVDELAEQAGYTWFNRIIAIKFMEHHDYLPTTASWFSNDDGSEYPEIVHDAVHQAQLIGMDTTKVDRLYQNHRYDEVYRELFIGLCNSLHDSLGFLFERIDDWSMLLFPQQLMGPSHIIKHEKQGLLTIPEEDRQEVEIIGWIYQYYINEKKDELIQSKKKYTDEEITYVTQLFTSKWIVEYMVHNTVGKTRLQNRPDQELQKKRQFLIEVNPDSEHITLHDPKEITVLDPACGSGHILVTSYDVLYDIYLQAGYTRSSIPQLILENNLFGFEICPRAHQLSCFAVTMKARHDDPEISHKVDIAKHIICLEENNNYEQVDEKKYPHLRSFLKNWYKAHTYGSLIHVEEFRKEQVLAEYEMFQSQDGLFADSIVRKESLDKMIHQAGLLSQKYSNVIANPPYLPASRMPEDLKTFVEKYFPDYKADLFAVFIVTSIKYLPKGGNLGFMTPYVRLYIQTYKKLREFILSNCSITSLVQLEYNSFENACIPICTFTLNNNKNGTNGIYISLSEFVGSEIQGTKALEAIESNNCNYCYDKDQSLFNLIPGNPIIYTLPDNIIKLFGKVEPLGNSTEIKVGIQTGDNNRFLRQWFEVNKENLSLFDGIKRFPHLKGGSYRKRYGNLDYVVNRENNGYEIKNFIGTNGRLKSRPQNVNYFFNESLTFSHSSSSHFGVRYTEKDTFTFNVEAPSIFSDQNITLNFKYLLCLLLSKVGTNIVKSLSPTLSFNVNDLKKIPYITNHNSVDLLTAIGGRNILISKKEWNFHETSRDFQKFPLIEYKEATLEASYQEFCNTRTEKFLELHSNEEELNREFIKIYGLEDELTPDVPLSEITILQEELDTKKLKEKEESIKESRKLPWKRTVIAEQLMSYMLGCMMGRYSLDHDGLIYAGGEYDASKYTTFPADEDGIIPVLDDEYFTDDIVNRSKEFIKTLRGEASFTQNWNRLAQALGGSRNQSADEVIRNYRRKSFSDDHFKRYKKRPIYRYFSSNEKKGKGVFQAIVYLHRYDKDTISRIRNTYLDKFQRKVHNMIEHQEARKKEELDTKKLAQIEKELKTLHEMQTELAQYDERLKHVAEERIELDLDDGVKENYGLMMEKGLVVKYKL